MGVIDPLAEVLDVALGTVTLLAVMVLAGGLEGNLKSASCKRSVNVSLTSGNS